MSEVVRVGVVGAGGRMGREVCRAVLGRPGLELVCAVDPGFVGAGLSALVGADAGSLEVAGDVAVLAEAEVEVAVDFTRIEAARADTPVLRGGRHPRRGGAPRASPRRTSTTWRRRFAGPEAGAPNCVVAANFAIGAVLLMRFGELAAPQFDSVRDHRAPP